MRGGVFLIVIALILVYMGVSGRYKCVTTGLRCLVGIDPLCDCKAGTPQGTTPSTPGTTPPFTIPGISPLPSVEPLRGVFT